MKRVRENLVAHNTIRCEKRKYIQNIIKDAEQDFRINRTRNMYMDKSKWLMRGFLKKKKTVS